ncbi:MAG: ParB/RepB/Spo0J family partition protein [Planctomycetes bacterium]|nr:ParB/RepB/Spo0J family partition protein [Planctomycetota bacterium]
MTDQLEKTPKSQGPARRRLGRGLNALLGNHAEVEPTDSSGRRDETGSMRQIAVDSIERNPFQPRKEFGDASLQELAASIGQHGLLQPLLVRRRGGNFQLIAGERRWLAAQQAGLETVPCHIIERDDRGSTEAAIEENLKRKDLNPLEKATAFQDYRDRFGCSIEELAQKLSMQRSTVSNFLRLLELPDAVKEALSQDRISNGHARALLSVTQAAHRIELCRRIERESLSVRATEAEVRKLLKSKGTIPFPKKDEHSPASQLTSHLRSLQEQLRQQLGAKVEIRPSGKERGKIVIHFQSNDDFERILRQLRRAA